MDSESKSKRRFGIVPLAVLLRLHAGQIAFSPRSCLDIKQVVVWKGKDTAAE